MAFDPKGLELLTLDCAPRGRALFGRFHELLCDGGSFHLREAGPWVGMQVAKSGAFTIELTLTPAEAPAKSPGVLFAYGDNGGEDAALLQDSTGLALRVGGKKVFALFALGAGTPVHVVVTCDKEKWAAYCGGKPAGSGALPAGATAWGARQLVIGAAWSGADLWRGRMEGIAIFSRALTATEATGEATVSKAVQAERKPATKIRFRGTLLRQAKTSSIEEIRPYTRSLTAAEYKVDRVLAGEWKHPTITVLHWMIMDGKRLPIADRQPGMAVELSVEPLDEHPQLESSRRDEIEGNDIAADLFYCESETGP
ncbi:MAG: LamG domain-containing protein [Chthoniobacter sp.]|nr:LamG domain-containing protein [Chthoniobacter sp.]